MLVVTFWDTCQQINFLAIIVNYCIVKLSYSILDFLFQMVTEHVLLGDFAKLRNRLLASSSLSVRMEQLGSHWTDFYEIWYLSIFRCTTQKIEITLKSDNNNRYFTGRPKYIFYNISLSSS